MGSVGSTASLQEQSSEVQGQSGDLTGFWYTYAASEDPEDRSKIVDRFEMRAKSGIISSWYQVFRGGVHKPGDHVTVDGDTLKHPTGITGELLPCGDLGWFVPADSAEFTFKCRRMPDAWQHHEKRACIQFVTGWSGLALHDLAISDLAGGASGQRVCKVSVADEALSRLAAGTVAHVLYKECAQHSAAISGAAMRAFSQDPADRNFCGTIYLAGNPEFPGILITEFAGGSMIQPGHMYDDVRDCQSYGRLLGLLHSHESSWFAEVEPSPDKELAELPEEARAGFIRQAKQDQYAQLICYDTLQMHKWGHSPKPDGVFAALPQEDQVKAQQWFRRASEVAAEAMDLGEGNSLMDRIVVVHGDCHVKQFIHREEQPGKLLMVDFDTMHRAPAWYDWGGVPMDWFFSGMLQGQPYAPLEKRQQSAQAYLDALGDQAAQYDRNTVADIVFDVNKGIVGRCVFLCYVLVYFLGVSQKGYESWLMLVLAQKSAEVIRRAKADPALKETVLEKGVLQVVCDENAEALGTFNSNKTEETAALLSDIPLGPVSVPQSFCSLM